MREKTKAARRQPGGGDETRAASDVSYSTTAVTRRQIRPMRVVCAPALAVCDRLGLLRPRSDLLALCERWGRRGR